MINSEFRVGQFHRCEHNRLALKIAVTTKAKHSDNFLYSPTDRLSVTEIFRLEHTVPASMLPTVTLSLPWLPVLVGQIAWRHSAVLHLNMEI